MRREIGTRVGAILKGDAKSVYLIGFGAYQGEEVPPVDSGGFGPDLHDMGIPSPKLVMDDGQILYGCECWWGSEDQVKKRIQGMAIIPVNMAEERVRRSVG